MARYVFANGYLARPLNLVVRWHLNDRDLPMNIATLNAEGNGPAFEALAHSLQVPLSSKWKQGQRRRNGSAYATDGFQLLIADVDTPVELVRSVQAFVAHCERQGITFAKAGTTALLSVGITVGDSHQFAAAVEFSAAELRALAERGISLSVTAYPTSEEASANEGAI